jgi:serine/threonine protein kinase
MRVLIKVQKSDPPKLDRPGKWSPFFNDFLDCCLKKSPNDRCSAEQLKSVSFVRTKNSLFQFSIRLSKTLLIQDRFLN